MKIILACSQYLQATHSLKQCLKYRFSLINLSVCLLASLLMATNAQASSLLDSYIKAHEYDAQLKMARANLAINSETAKQALAPLLPQVGVKYGIVRERTDLDLTGNQVIGGFSIPIRTGTYSTDSNQRAGQVSISQPLFDLEKWFDYKGGQQISIGARADYIYQRYELITRVAESYFNVAKEKSILENSRAEEQSIKEDLRIITLYYDEGVSSIADLHEAEAAYDLVRANTLQSANNFAVSQEALSALTGEMNPDVWQLSDNYPIKPMQPNNAEGWIKTALQRNWRIRSSNFTVIAAENNVKAKSANMLPTVNGTLAYSKIDNEGDNNNFGTDSDRQITQKSAAIDVDLALYAGGAITSAKRQAIAELQLRQHEATQLRRDITQSVKRLFLTQQTLEQQIKAQQRSVRSAQTSLRTTKFGYSNGTRDLTDVLQAQRTLYNAKRNYQQARYDYIINYTRLKHHAGLITTQDIININKWLVADNSTPS